MAVPTPPSPLTLIMPLEPGLHPNDLLHLLGQQQGAIDQALGVVGTVHYARFVLFDASSPNLQPMANSTGPFQLAVITTYDGDFDLYIQDFVKELGPVFDALLGVTADGADLVPVKDHVTQFTAWVAANDASQRPPNSLLSQYAAYPYGVQTILAECGT